MVGSPICLAIHINYLDTFVFAQIWIFMVWKVVSLLKRENAPIAIISFNDKLSIEKKNQKYACR
jgi:hypothetical protein